MFHLYPKLALVVDWYFCCGVYFVWIQRGRKSRELSIHFVDVDIVSFISIIFEFNYCPIVTIYTLLIQIHTPSIFLVTAAGISTIERQKLIPGCVWQFRFQTHQLRTPRLDLFVPIVFRFRNGGMGVGMTKFLAVVAVICGLLTIFTLLRAKFSMTSFVSVSRWWGRRTRR
jgi:hypothetical protein